MATLNGLLQGTLKRSEPKRRAPGGSFAEKNLYAPPKDWGVTVAKIVVTLAVVVASWLILNLSEDWLTEPISPEDEDLPDRATRYRRAATFGSAIIAFLRTLLIVATILIVLHHLGLRTTTLVTLASILSLVLGLAAQRILQDLFTGTVLLAEGQLLNGDYVQLLICGGSTVMSGIVENISLRRIKLRNFENEIIYVPNSQIHAITNASQNFPVVRLRVMVSRTADSAAVLQVLSETTARLATDPIMRSHLPPGSEEIGRRAGPSQPGVESTASDPYAVKRLLRSLDAVSMAGPEPELLGVSDVAANGFEAMVRFMVNIDKQWAAGRYVRQRLVEALEPFGPVAQVVQLLPQQQ
jgi:small-conductance mechanosensitive channel